MIGNDNVIDVLATADYDYISRYRELKAISEEVSRIEFFLYKETTIGLIPTGNDVLGEMKDFLIAQGLDVKHKCKLFSDRQNKERENKKANPRFFTRWAAVELYFNGHLIRIANSTAMTKYGIQVDDEWKYFRSFANVTKIINSKVK